MATPYQGFETDTQSREQDIRTAYSQMRKGLGASRDVSRRRSMQELAQKEAAIGGFGGAGMKMRQQAQAEIDRGFGAEEANVGAQEASALQQLKSEVTGQKFQAEEAQKQRDLAESQFGRTLEFQKGSFADQMQFNWAEMDENKKTNFINAMIAMRDAGLKLQSDWDQMLRNKVTPELYKNYVGLQPAWGGGTVSVGKTQPSGTPAKYRV